MPELYLTPLINDANLSAYYRMEGNSNDTTINANNGTDTSMSYSAAGGRFGEGAVFNGTTSLISLPFSLAGVTNGTWSMWFKTSTSQNVYLGGANDASSRFVRWSQTAADKISFSIDTNGSGTVSLLSTAVITDGLWHMATATWGAAGGVLYYDGLSVSTDVSTSAPNCSAHNYLGVLNNNGTALNYWAGDQDEVAFFNDALTAGEVQTLYNTQGGGFLYSFL